MKEHFAKHSKKKCIKKQSNIKIKQSKKNKKKY